MSSQVRCCELFCGIGGFRLGLERAGSKISNSSWKVQRMGNDGERKSCIEGRCVESYAFNCVWANDFDKYACQIYRKNFGGKELVEADIHTINTDSIPDFDLLTAGFPCQSFSLAGKRKGFEDTRGTLFFEIARIAEAKRPKLLLLENVKGLLSNNEGKTFHTILQTLDELGYNVEWQVLNSKYFGVPQNRERVFIIGHSRNAGTEQIFPIGEADNVASGKVEEQPEQVSTAIDSNYYKGADKHGQRTVIWQQSTQEEKGGIKTRQDIVPTLGERMGTGGRNTPMVLATETAYTKANMRSGRFSDVVHALDGGNSKAVFEGSKIRRLTPVECERLQGFPDFFTAQGLDVNGNAIPISDTQRYKLLGNAVTTNVVAFLGLKILEA